MFIIKWFLSLFKYKGQNTSLSPYTTCYEKYLNENDGLIDYVLKKDSKILNINIDLSYTILVPVTVNGKRWEHVFKRRDEAKVLINCIKTHMYPTISDKPFLTQKQVRSLKDAFNKKLDFNLKLDDFKISVTFGR